MKKGSDEEYTVANLSIKKRLLQATLELEFGPSESIHLRLTGEELPVNLVGVRVSMKTESVDGHGNYQSQSSLESNRMVGGKRKATSADGVPAKKPRQDNHGLTAKSEILLGKDNVDKTYNPLAGSNFVQKSNKLKKLAVEEEAESEDENEESSDEEDENEETSDDEDENEESSDEDDDFEDESTLNESSIEYDTEEIKLHPRYKDHENYSVELESTGK